MHLLLVFLLLTNIQAQQNPCSCTCCNSPSCNPTSLPTIYVQTCTLEICLATCRATYFQCQGNPYGQISAQCGSTAVPQFNCRCECCNMGSTSCSPLNVGNTLAFTCQTGACSIACQTQYPRQCVVDQNGQTLGTCIGLITTTSTTTPTTTIGPWLGHTCSCMCYNTGSYCSSAYIGTTSASQCTSADCTQACRNRYSSSCSCSSLSYTGQINGTCISGATAGNTRCGCQCCNTNGCISYEIGTNGGCETCNSVCRQYTRCSVTDPVTTLTCYFNNAKASFPWLIFILIITFCTFFIIN